MRWHWAKLPEVIDRRHSEILLILRVSAQRTGVDSQSVGIDVVVDSDALREALVAQTAFQDLGGADGPVVINSDKLGPRLGATEFHMFALVANGPTDCGRPGRSRLVVQTIAKKILHRDAMVLIKDVIKLHMEVVDV